jgi:hypothetical protein
MFTPVSLDTSRDAGDQSRGQRRTDAGNVIKPLARLVRPVPGDDHTVELQDLRLRGSSRRDLRERSMSRHTRATTVVSHPPGPALVFDRQILVW